MLFAGSYEECEQLVNWLNSLVPGVVRFKFDFSNHKVEFLDLEIFLKEGKLKTNLFIKPSNKQLYLDFSSNHPEHCKVGIPYSQALRVVERCSETEEQEKQLKNLKEKLKDRNYPDKVIDEKFGKARNKDRRTLIFQNRKDKNGGNKKVRFMFTHNTANPPIHKWLRMCKPLLERSAKAKDIGSKIQICTKQPRNLKTILGGYREKTRVSQNVPANTGCSKCAKNCKVSCPMMKEGKTFKSTRTKRTYPIRQNVDCDSEWVIYLITCRKCLGQYVGKSKTKFKLRHSNHKQEVKRQIGGLGSHYGGLDGCGYANMSIQIIEQIEHKNMKNLAMREQFWQNQLRVFVENGCKNHCLRKDFEK